MDSKMALAMMDLLNLNFFFRSLLLVARSMNLRQLLSTTKFQTFFTASDGSTNGSHSHTHLSSSVNAGILLHPRGTQISLRSPCLIFPASDCTGLTTVSFTAHTVRECLFDITHPKRSPLCITWCARWVLSKFSITFICFSPMNFMFCGSCLLHPY
jgi:hypothetical protein